MKKTLLTALLAVVAMAFTVSASANVALASQAGHFKGHQTKAKAHVKAAAKPAKKAASASKK